MRDQQPLMRCLRALRARCPHVVIVMAVACREAATQATFLSGMRAMGNVMCLAADADRHDALYGKIRVNVYQLSGADHDGGSQPYSQLEATEAVAEVEAAAEEPVPTEAAAAAEAGSAEAVAAAEAVSAEACAMVASLLGDETEESSCHAPCAG